LFVDGAQGVTFVVLALPMRQLRFRSQLVGSVEIAVV
jgi:hypothetical protein